MSTFKERFNLLYEKSGQSQEEFGKNFSITKDQVFNWRNGLGQIMPATAKELDINPYSMEENIYGSAKYLRKMLNYNDNNISLALASYNAGYGNVQKQGGIPPFNETQNYVKNVMNTYEQLTEFYRKKKPKNQHTQSSSVNNKKIGKKNDIFFPI